MPRGRRRKIEVPTDTQPQFELGDTAEDIERRRRKRDERDERERIEQEERDRERMEREEGREPGKGREESVDRHRYWCRINSIQTEEGADEVHFPE